MTLPEHIIKVRDLTSKALNSKEELLRSGKMKKPFIFKGYKTETDRIKDTVKNNKYLYNIFENKEPNKKNNEKKEDIFNFNVQNPNKLIRKASIVMSPEQIKYVLKNDVIIQPQMRFKPRTDLERVYDALNGRYFNGDEKGILKRQLKNIGLFSYEKKKDIIRKVSLLNGKDERFDSNDEENEEDELMNNKRAYQIKPQILVQEDKKEDKVKKSIYGDGKVYYTPKHFEYKPWIRNKHLNSEAERILKEFHIKTHFKGAEEIAENKIVTKKDEKKKNRERIKKKEIRNKRLKDPFYFEKTHFKEEEPESKYVIYEKNKNPFTHKKTEKYEQSALNILSNLAFKVPHEFPHSLSETKSSFFKKKVNDSDEKFNKKKLIDENNVLINGEIYYKDSQFDIIANKVLQSCHVYSQKSLHNNTRLKKGEGKNMITRGMSVNEFERKYNLFE